MADNINVNPGTGGSAKAVATDEVGGVHFQRVKMTFGTDGVAADVSNASPMPINQVSAGYDVAASFSRPADTAAYSAGDVVGGVLRFQNVGPAGGSVVVTSFQLEIDRAGVPAGMTGYRLHLYNVTPPSALADNAPFAFPAGDRAAYLGYVDIDAPVDLGGTLYSEVNNIGKQVKLLGTDAWAYMVTASAYTPGNATPYKPTLHTVAL